MKYERDTCVSRLKWLDVTRGHSQYSVRVAGLQADHKASIAKRKDDIERVGYFTTDSGEERMSWGNKKGSDETKRIMAIAREASCQSKIDAMIAWREKSKAVKFAIRKRAEGWGVTQIAEEFGKLYEDAPDVYCTPKGVKPTKGTVSKWLKEVKEKQSKTDNN